MLTIEKKGKEKLLEVTMRGTIDETTHFDSLIGFPFAEMHFICEDIDRINSAGIRLWCKYFKHLKDQGIKIQFHRCASTLIRQLQYIRNFICPEDLQSICADFYCEKCQNVTVQILQVEELKKNGCSLPSVQCKACGGSMVFDEVPESYFKFMSPSL